MRRIMPCLFAFSLLSVGACVQDSDRDDAAEAAIVESLDVSILCRSTEADVFYYADETLTHAVGHAFYPCCAGPILLWGRRTPFIDVIDGDACFGDPEGAPTE